MQNEISVEEIASKLYELDVKVYNATGSKMGKVFPAGKELTVKKMVKLLNSDKRHFIKQETTLISNMIKTIKDSNVEEECREELNVLCKLLEEFNPPRVLPDSFMGNIANMKNLFANGEHRIICIGREYGSGGHEIGYQLSQRLGLSYFDNEIIRMACEHLGKEFDDNSFGNRRETVFEKNKFRFHKFPGNDELFFAQSDMIEKMARQEDCIFMGRCADTVLEHAGIPRVSVFIRAPFEDRVKHEMQCSNLGMDDAMDLVRHMDKVRKSYYNYYTGRHWGHSENYDLCINTACYGIEGTVDLLEKMYNLFS